MKDLLRDYFTFSKKERIGVIVLLVLIMATTLFIYYYPLSTVTVSPEETARLQEQLSLLEKARDTTTGYGRAGQYTARAHDDERSPDWADDRPVEGTLFAFDPNTLPAEGWRRLGLREKTVTTILHYREKGGRFRKPEDLFRMYGLSRTEGERLLPYVRLEEVASRKWEADAGRGGSRFDTAYGARRFTDSGRRWPGGYERKALAPFDINTADTTAFIALRGIGSKLAIRIVRFREKLGGFHAVDQVGETYGLPDSTWQQIKPFLLCQVTTLRTYDINTASADSLRLHPYLSWQVANAIVQYRQQHGPFSSVDQLLQIAIVTPELLGKVRPYLAVKAGE